MICQNVHALKPWHSQVPSALKPVNGDLAQLVALVNDGVLTYPQAKKKVKVNFVSTESNKTKKSFNDKVNFVSSAVIINATPDKVKSILTNYAAYPKVFPKLVSAKVIKRKNNLARVKYRAVIKTALPVFKFDETFTFRHQVSGNKLSTWIEYSPVKYGMGEFEWHAIKTGKHQGKTLLTLTQWGALNDMRGILLPIILKAMPELKLSITMGINGYVMEALRLHFNGKDKPAQVYPQKTIIPTWKTSPKATVALKSLLPLTDDLPVMYAHPYRKLKNETNLRFVSSFQKMPTTSKTVANWLMSPDNYPKLFRQVKEVKRTPKTQNNQKGELVDTKVKIGLGVVAISFKTKIFFTRPKQNHAKFYGAGGDVRWIAGEFKTVKKDAKTSYLMTTMASKTDKNAPFLLRISHSLPYNDYLNIVGLAPLFGLRVKKSLKKYR